MTGDEGYFDHPNTYDYGKVLGVKPPGNTINALN